MSYTHRATQLPDSHPETDRCVYHGSDYIGRVYVRTGGPQGGRFSWFLGWCSLNNSGDVDSMEAGLEVIKARHQEAGPGKVMLSTGRGPWKPGLS